MSDTKISKDEFIKYMNNIAAICELQDFVMKATVDFNKKTKEDASIFMPSNIYDTVKLLQIVMDDENEFIDYWAFELDCGKNNDRLKVYDENKEEIPMTTPEDVWNAIISFHE